MNKNKVNHELMMQLDRVGSVIAVHEGFFQGELSFHSLKFLSNFWKFQIKENLNLNHQQKWKPLSIPQYLKLYFLEKKNDFPS